MSLQVAGIEVNPAIIAPLDPGFLSASLFTRNYRELVSGSGGVSLRLALERGDGSISTFRIGVCALRRPRPGARRLQRFPPLWRDAEPDTPILKQAKAEYAEMQ